MAQIKGQTGNPYGRTKGSKNKVSAEIKERIATLLEEKFDSFAEDYDSITDKTVKCKIYLEAAKLVIPKPTESKEEEEKESQHQELLKRLFPARFE